MADLRYLAGIFLITDGNIRSLAFFYLCIIILGYIDVHTDFICVLQGKKLHSLCHCCSLLHCRLGNNAVKICRDTFFSFRNKFFCRFGIQFCKIIADSQLLFFFLCKAGRICLCNGFLCGKIGLKICQIRTCLINGILNS